MTRSFWMGLALLTSVSLANWGIVAQEQPATEAAGESAANPQASEESDDKGPVDQTELYRAYQKAHGSQLQTKFEPGTVTQRTLDADAIKATVDGFDIQFPSQAPIPTPAVVGKRLFVSGGFHSREYYCFDAATGKLAWAVDLSDDGPSSAVESDGVLLFNTESCTIFALDAATGKHLWSAWLGDPLVSTPTIAQGRVYTIYPVGHGHAELQQQLAPVEPAQENEDVPEKEAKPDAEAEAIAPRHALICFELKTGKILWQHYVDHDAITAPVAAGDELYVATLAGTMFRFRSADGHLISARKERATSAPVVVGGEMYFTRRSDKVQGEEREVREAIVKQDRVRDLDAFEVESRVAAYLDAEVQEASKLADQTLKLDAGNGLGGLGGFGAAGQGAGGGFGGGGAVNGNLPANGAFSLEALQSQTEVLQSQNPEAVPFFGTATANLGQAAVSCFQNFQGSRVVTIGETNINCMGDTVIATSAKSGESLWEHKLEGDLTAEGGSLGAAPAAAGGKIILATLGGKVLILDPKQGETTKTLDVGTPLRFQPIVMHGRIYLGTLDGRLICLNTNDATLTGWSMIGGDAGHSGQVKK